MASRPRKLVVLAYPSCVDLSILLQPVLAIVPDLLYFAISFNHGKVCVYMQSTEYMSRDKRTGLAEFFEQHMDNIDIIPYATVEGELQEEWRSKRKRGISTIASADTNVVFVNPLGDESLQHITREYVVDLLKQMLNISVFFEFGLKLYSLEKNMNFRARKKYKYVRLRIKDKWITVSKDQAYDELLCVLVAKTQEAVELYKDSIPVYYMNHFNTYLTVLFEHRDSLVPKFKKLYKKDRNKGLDTIAVSVNDKLSRLRSWGGKKIKLQ